MRFVISGALLKKIMILFSKIQGEADLVITKNGIGCKFKFVSYVEDCFLTWEIDNIEAIDVPDEYYSCNTLSITDINRSIVINDRPLELTIGDEYVTILSREVFTQHTKPVESAFNQRYQILLKIISDTGSLNSDNYNDIVAQMKIEAMSPRVIALFGIKELETILNNSIQNQSMLTFEIEDNTMKFITGVRGTFYSLDNKLFYPNPLTTKHYISLERIRYIKELKLVAQTVWIEYVIVDGYYGLRIKPITTYKTVEMVVIMNRNQ